MNILLAVYLYTLLMIFLGSIELLYKGCTKDFLCIFLYKFDILKLVTKVGDLSKGLPNSIA